MSAFTGLTTSQVAALTTTQIAALTVTDMAGLTPVQMPALTTLNISLLSTSNVNAIPVIDIPALTTSQVVALTTGDIAALTTSQVPAITTTDVRALSTSQVAALTYVEIASLTSPQIASMSTSQVAALLYTPVPHSTSQIMVDADKFGMNYGRQIKFIQHLARDASYNAIKTKAIPALTDNSGGSEAGPLVSMTALLPPATVLTGSTGCANTEFATSMAALRNDMAVLATQVNTVFDVLGVATLDISEGVVASPHTVPVLTNVSSLVAAGSAVDSVTGQAAINTANGNLATMILAVNRALSSIGAAPLVNVTGYTDNAQNFGLLPIANPVVTVNASLTEVAVAAWLTAYANAVAYISATLNAAFASMVARNPTAISLSY